MRTLFGKLREVLRRGEDAVLVLVVAGNGSVPRGAGACMLVTRDGRLAGTIGGGAVEHRGERMALEVLQGRRSRFEVYRLRESEVQDLGMVCGGEVRVFFRYLPAGDNVILTLAEGVEELLAAGKPCGLVCEIVPDTGGAIGVWARRGGVRGMDLPNEAAGRAADQPALFQAEGRDYFGMPLLRAGVVYIFGGGHVAQALVPALTAVDFRCVVLEDRADFCDPALFGGLAATRLIDNRRVADFVSISAEDSIVIMTRGHKDDQLIQAQVLQTPARYIGVIGSRRKTETVFANLRQMGFSQRDLARITTPIGLEIGAETPAEIAVSITAQLILLRRT